MKHSEILDWAMRGVIETMRQEQSEVRQLILNNILKELAAMYALALQKERE